MNMSYERVELFTWELQKRVPVQVKGETVLTGVHRGVTSRPGIRGVKGQAETRGTGTWTRKYCVLPEVQLP